MPGSPLADGLFVGRVEDARRTPVHLAGQLDDGRAADRVHGCLTGLLHRRLLHVPPVRNGRGAAGPHGEPDGVPRAVRAHLHGVHHVPDEEQAPAARPLLSVQLQREVRLFHRPRRLVLSPEVGDGHDDVVAVLGDLDVHRDLGPPAVAVLDRVHRGLGHGGLQSFRPGRRPARWPPPPRRPGPGPGARCLAHWPPRTPRAAAGPAGPARSSAASRVHGRTWSAPGTPA